MEIEHLLQHIHQIQYKQKIGLMGILLNLYLLIYFYKFSFGQVTTAGIEQSYRLGVYFRTRYGSLLNSKYNRSEIYVRSTDFDRALMSAQSNLAALYPLPKKSESKVPFQPVPIHTVPITQDFVCYFQR